MIISSTEKIASELLNEIKTEFLENDMLRASFKFKKLLKEDQTEIIGLFEGGAKFRVIAKGAEQKMRGTKWERKRPDLVLADDMEEDEAVLSPERRTKFREWFFGAVRPIVADHGMVGVWGTILSLDSLLANLMPDETNSATIVEPLKTYTLDPYKGWFSAIYRAHGPRFTPVLWEAKSTSEDWKERYDEFCRIGLAEKYNQEYLNNPVDDTTAYFKSEYFRAVDPQMMPTGRPLRYYAAIDLAISKNARADYTAIVVAGFDPQNRVEIVHVRRGHWDTQEIVQNMLEVQAWYRPDLFAIEKGLLEKSIGPYLQSEMLRRNVIVNLHPLPATGDKMARARSMQGRMKMGGVYFQKDMPWYSEFFDEVSKFPRGKHDDMTDAFSYIGLMLDQIVTPPTASEEAEFELEAARRENTRLGGRNKTTGY
ncbi:MAG: phage terminase large subunit [Patescibacteria group bacterium]|nr:phage terminase large subunit [Patescibacteria group bacterium]